MYAPGDRLVQRVGTDFKAIAKNPQSFYTGDIARAIAADMAKNGGLITLETSNPTNLSGVLPSVQFP